MLGLLADTERMSTTEPTNGTPRRRDDSGAELVRQARAASGSRYGSSPNALMRRAARAFGGALGEGIGEAVFGLLSLGVFAGIAALTAWGWSRSKPGTVAVYVPVVAFLAYGVVQLWHRWRGHKAPSRAKRIAEAAVISVAVVGVWLVSVVQYGMLVGR